MHSFAVSWNDSFAEPLLKLQVMSSKHQPKQLRISQNNETQTSEYWTILDFSLLP